MGIIGEIRLRLKVICSTPRVLVSHGELAKISHVAVENPDGSYVVWKGWCPVA